MKRLIILYLAFLISAAFDQVQGTFFTHHFFPLSNLEMILPEYLSWISKLSGVSLVMWMSYSQETEYSKQFKIAALLTTGFLVDFIIEGTQGWFNIGSYAFGYRAIVFIIFGLVIVKTILKSGFE